MAKSYDFRIALYPAQFEERAGIKYQAVIFNGKGLGEFAFEGTLAAAVIKRAEISAGLKAPHAAYLSMRYRDARKAPGLSNKTLIFGGEGA